MGLRHCNLQDSLDFEFLNTLIPQCLNLFGVRPVEFRYADLPKAGSRRASA